VAIKRVAAEETPSQHKDRVFTAFLTCLSSCAAVKADKRQLDAFRFIFMPCYRRVAADETLRS